MSQCNCFPPVIFFPPSSCVEALLAAGADVNSTAAAGQTPLFLACEAGRPECVRLLLSAGADRARTTAVRPLEILLDCVGVKTL